MKMIRAKVQTSPKPVTEIQEVPVITKELLELAPEDIANELLEMDIIENCEIAIQVADVPSGAVVRKPFGQQKYARACDSYVRKELEIQDLRVLMVADGHRVSLMAPDEVVVTTLEELFGSEWSLIDSCLVDFRCLK